MRVVATTALAAALAIGAAHAATVKPMSPADARAKCKAEYSTFDAEKRRSRTGYSFEQDMTFCVKQKTRQ
jgi:hypothetical protein